MTMGPAWVQRDALSRRTIPCVNTPIAVAAVEGALDLAAAGLLGKAITLQAEGLDITIQRSGGAANIPLVAGQGFIIRNGLYETFYVDPAETLTWLHYRSTGACTLRILYDDGT